MEIFIIVISTITVVLIASVFILYRRLVKLSDEVLNMRYIKVEKLEGGGWSLKTRDDKSIFEL